MKSAKSAKSLLTSLDSVKSTNESLVFPNFPLYTMLKNNTAALADVPLSAEYLDEICLKIFKMNNIVDEKNRKSNGIKFVLNGKETNLNEEAVLHYNDQEIIYALIKAYSLDTDKNENNFPYKSEDNSLGVKFILENMPIQLQRILLSFLRLDKT
jgi:hypothetical protein